MGCEVASLLSVKFHSGYELSEKDYQDVSAIRNMLFSRADEYSPFRDRP